VTDIDVLNGIVADCTQGGEGEECIELQNECDVGLDLTDFNASFLTDEVVLAALESDEPNAVCYAAIELAIAAALGYAVDSDEPPQIDIGFLLCQLALLRPDLQPFIVDRIDLSENELLEVGCSAAVAPGAGPGQGILTPG